MSTCLFIYFFYKMSSCWFLIEFRYISDNLFHKSFQMEEKQEKKSIFKKWRFWAIIILIVFAILGESDNQSTMNTTTRTTSNVQQIDATQERINRLKELFAEESAFEKIEKIENNAIWIYFTSAPSEDIETITRWQAMNLSKEVNWIASVKTFVWWTAQMFCTATKWTVNDCIDYR